MDLPLSGAEPIKKNEQIVEEEIIENPFSGKEKLTCTEAIDCINRLSGVLLAHGYYRSQEKH